MKRTGSAKASWSLALAAGLCVLLPATQASAEERGYHVVKSAALPGDGGWDFLAVDAAGRRLYVTHGDSVQVLDADSLKLLGTVENVPRPHGVVVLPALGRGYISSGEPGSVVAFDLKTLKRIGDVPTSKDTDVILYEPVSSHIFTFNGDSGNSTVIDPGTLKVVGTLELGGSPEVAVADGKGIIYDNLSDKGEVLKIDARTLRDPGPMERRAGTVRDEHGTGPSSRPHLHRLQKQDDGCDGRGHWQGRADSPHR